MHKSSMYDKDQTGETLFTCHGWPESNPDRILLLVLLSWSASRLPFRVVPHRFAIRHT
ncbi:hypothetical protein Plhal304r1_c007g0027871 [Plasmopara halstedii]